jgi:hypothetical protein
MVLLSAYSQVVRPIEVLIDAMRTGLQPVSLQDILGWFGSCGLGATHG